MEKVTFCWLEVGTGCFGAASSSTPPSLPMCLWRSSHSCRQGHRFLIDEGRMLFPHVVGVRFEVRKGTFPEKAALRPLAGPAHLFSCLGLPWRLSKRVLATIIVHLVLKSEQQVGHGGHLAHSHACTQALHARPGCPSSPGLPLRACCWVRASCWEGDRRNAATFSPREGKAKYIQCVLSPPSPSWQIFPR